VSDQTPDLVSHWDGRYLSVGSKRVSWYQDAPTMSLDLIDALDISIATPIIDVGGGASTLVDRLLQRGHEDLTILDISAVALDTARERLDDPTGVTWVHQNLLTWRPSRRWGLWHDRAVLHFLTEARDQATYLTLLRRALNPDGAFIIGTFAEDGPTHCSSLAVSRYSADQLSTMFEEFDLIAHRREVHRTPRGADQPFNWIAGRRRSHP